MHKPPVLAHQQPATNSTRREHESSVSRTTSSRCHTRSPRNQCQNNTWYSQSPGTSRCPATPTVQRFGMLRRQHKSATRNADVCRPPRYSEVAACLVHRPDAPPKSQHQSKKRARPTNKFASLLSTSSRKACWHGAWAKSEPASGTCENTQPKRLRAPPRLPK